MKKLLLLGLCFLLVGCGTKKEETPPPDVKPKTETQLFQEEYAAFDKDGIKVTIDEKTSISYKDVDKALEFLKSGTGIIYLGFASDPWSRNLIPLLCTKALENNKTINYFDVQKVDVSKNETQIKEIQTIINAYLETSSDEKKKLHTPTVFFMKEGKIVGHHFATVKAQTNPNVILTEEQAKELQQIYQDLINAIQ